MDRFPIRSDSIRLGKTPPTRISQKKDPLSNKGGALVLSYLEVERAVHAVLLRPEDARQVFRHDDDDDDERRMYTEGKIWSLKKVANFVGEKIRVKRDTHTHTTLEGSRTRIIEKTTTGSVWGRSKASKNVKRETPFLNDSNETSIASLKRTPLRALKKIDIIIRFQMPHNKSEALSH